jgi:hypothetical protein
MQNDQMDLNPDAQSIRGIGKNLGRAGLALALAILGTTALSFALQGLDADPAWALLFASGAFPFAAGFMALAARRQGRSALMYRLVALLPPLAIIASYTLYRRDLEIRFDCPASDKDQV